MTSPSSERMISETEAPASLLMSETAAMTEQELTINQRLHAALGHVWDETRCRVCGWRLADSVLNGCVPGNCARRPVPSVRADAAPLYDFDPVAFEAVKAEIERRNLGAEFHERLAKLYFGEPFDEPRLRYSESFALSCAPLSIQCQAALAVLTENANG